MLNVEIDLFQPCLNIKAWAGFANPREVTMTDDFAIFRYVVVIADGREATSFVAGFQGFYREILGCSGCRAMNNN